jgi:ubiquinone/menaquinone biosynthesis C-methylase UbiE
VENSIANNLKTWDASYTWPESGEEWTGQAKACGVPYDTWKRSLIETLIIPNCRDRVVVEIGPGHGRWSEHIAPLASRLHLVDISEKCIENCRRRLSDFSNIEYYVTDGISVPTEHPVDFIFSFDSFVHMDASVIFRYCCEFRRILAADGSVIIHHANRRHLYLSFLRKFGYRSTRVYRFISQGSRKDDDGWRSNVSAKLVSKLARRSGLRTRDQFVYWNQTCGVPRYNDTMTVLGWKDS